MGLNINNKKTYHILDEYGFMMNQDELKNPDVLNGYGDAIGHNVDAYFAYDYKPFINPIKKCFIEKTDKKGTYIQGYRSPFHIDKSINNISRDHILNTLIIMKLEDEEFLKKLSKGLRWRISDRYTFTIDSWLWMKGISGNKFFMFLFYVIEIPVLILSILWNKTISLLGGFGKELPQDQYFLKSNDKISKRKRKLRKLLYPMYALNELSFQLYVTPNSLGKRILMKICLFGVDRQNFLLRILFGGKVNENDVYSYKPMYGSRWTTCLNDKNDRYLDIITNPDLIENNVVDVDLLQTIYSKQKKINE